MKKLTIFNRLTSLRTTPLLASLGMTTVIAFLLFSCTKPEGNGDDGNTDPTPTFVNQTFTAGGVPFDVVAVNGGSLYVGSVVSPLDSIPNVTISDFYIGKTEVTQELWYAVMGKSLSDIISDHSWNSYGIGNTHCMYDVSWYDAVTFCNKLSLLLGKTSVYSVEGVDFSTIVYSEIPSSDNATWNAAVINFSANGFRLPTEAEWEYAARGGQQTHGYRYSGSDSIKDVAWYYDNSDGLGSAHPDYGTHAVATKAANELGIYDMSGNVWEWCSDWYGGTYPSSATNPTGAASGSYRVFRGGSWYNYDDNCRVSYRNGGSPGDRNYAVGFRLACSYVE